MSIVSKMKYRWNAQLWVPEAPRGLLLRAARLRLSRRVQALASAVARTSWCSRFAAAVSHGPKLCFTQFPQLKSPVSGKRKFQGQRQSREIAAETLPAARRDFRYVRKPANCGHSSSVQEISANVGPRGGAGRTRTRCQARSHVERVSDTGR